MHVVVMGCGRVGATIAMRLDHEGHAVTVIDTDAYAFRRLSTEFRGEKLVGSGFDEGTLEAAGTRGAGAFLALTQGDNRNLLAAQMAKHLFDVPVVVARVYDPFRGEIYGNLGLRTFSPTSVGADMAYQAFTREQ
jgi:trk/ktr system potassium uptake protein